MKALYLAAALLVSTFAVSSASAAPGAPLAGLTVGSPLVQARVVIRHHRPHFIPGHHYRVAPHGWHRYHRRPHDWQHRGCIVVGPFWFCP